MANGEKYLAKDSSAISKRRLETQGKPRLMSRFEFEAHRTAVRRLEVTGSADVGFAAFALSAAEATLDTISAGTNTYTSAQVDMELTSFKGCKAADTIQISVFVNSTADYEIIKKTLPNGL